MSKRLIKPIENNTDKALTYRQMKGRYNKAMKEGFYFEAIAIGYAMIEDRLRSFIYHMGGLNTRSSLKLDNQTSKKFLIPLFNDYTDNKYQGINVGNISTKYNLIRAVMNWVTNTEGARDNYQFKLKFACENLDAKDVFCCLDELEQWCKYRNEIIHALMNKNLSSLYTELAEKAEVGMKLAVMVNAASRLLGFGFDDIQIAYMGKPGYEKYEGKTVHQIAKEEGISDLKAYLMLCEKSDFAGRVNMGPYSTPEIIHDLEHHEHVMYMTYAWVEDCGVQNPAIYDCFPKFLQDALTGIGDTLPNTIRKMTGAVADRFMLPGRGYLKEGYYADLTVFDEDAIRNGVPDQEKSFGIEKVFVNGKLVYNEENLDRDALKTTGRAIPVFG